MAGQATRIGVAGGDRHRTGCERTPPVGSIAPWRRTSCPGRRTTGCRPSSTTSPRGAGSRSPQKIERARELGDLSENGDYHAAKDEQGHMEGRIRQLESLLENAEIIEAPEPGVVGPGTIVTIVYEGDSDDDAERYLVGHIEEQTATSTSISPTAPLGAALLGARAGDTVELRGARTASCGSSVLEVEAA